MKSRNILLAALLLILVVAGGGAWLALRDAPPGASQAQPAGPYRIAVALPDGPPVVGDNRLRLTVRTAGGEVPPELRVRALAQMPEMPGMPAQEVSDWHAVEAGVYEGRLTLTMAGAWTLAVDAHSAAVGHGDLTLALQTGTPGLRVLAQTPEGVSHYTCPMHPSVRSPEQGSCPICGMRLQPVSGARPPDDVDMPGGVDDHDAHAAHAADSPPTDHAAMTGHSGMATQAGRAAEAMSPAMPAELPTLQLDARRRQLIGLRTAPARRRALEQSLRAPGVVVLDPTHVHEISLRFDGWIGALHVEAQGAVLAAGAPLFSVYGPELLAAQQEYLEAWRRQPQGALAQAAAQRLRLFGLGDAQLQALTRRGSPETYVTVRAPVAGAVLALDTVAGAAAPAGRPLLRMVDLSQLAVEADVYASDLAQIEAGTAATVRIPALPGAAPLAATVDVLPAAIDPRSRTGRVRLRLDAKTLAQLAHTAGAASPAAGGPVLRPQMYAEVDLHAAPGERLVVPREAVIFAGDTRVVFVDLGAGRLAPRRVRTGLRAGEYIEILEGVEAGESVVTSGNFLLASESRLQSGLTAW